VDFQRARGAGSALVVLAVLVTLAIAGAPAPAQAPTSVAGQVFAFGLNNYGQLGSTANTTTKNANPTPTLVALPGATGPVTEIATGLNHSLAVTSTGQLYAFGVNQYGQLGSANAVGSKGANPAPTLVTLPGAVGPVTEIAAGLNYSLAVTSTGQLYAFGDNRYGQLGNANNNGVAVANPTPTPVTLPGATGPVSEISAGASQSLAVTSTGQLYAFGENEYGQLGSMTNNGEESADPTPMLVALPGATGPVSQISAGSFDSLALTSTGQLYAFGLNEYGQLGSTTNNATTNANPTPTLVTLPGATGPASEISAGASHSLAVTSTGQLYAFGLNEYGQLGSTSGNATTNANPTPTLVTLPGATGPASEISAGVSHSLAVTSTGQLYAFGLNEYGQLGSTTNNGNEDANPTPTPVALPAGTVIETVAQGSAEQTLALTTAPPTITAASLAHRRFRVAKQPTAISARKAPLGTALRFTLAAPARLEITIVLSAPGLRHAHACVTPTTRLKRAHPKRCTRSVTVGALTRAREPEGIDSVAFSGRIGYHALRTGDYRALLSAENDAGRSNTVVLSFAIVR
jgi:alpha-tubulin suppressor-like RCC1 family protein